MLEEKYNIPDFIIAGAPKCGTTALAFFLSEHPGVCISRIKEPRFFTGIKGDMEKTIAGDGPRLSGNYEKGFKWYSSLFENVLKPWPVTSMVSGLFLLFPLSTMIRYSSCASFPNILRKVFANKFT